MDRRRAAGLLLALAACIAAATAAPTASNHTALDLYDGAPEGCYYNFQHYGEGDRIMTNEPCLNCTCHNRMLMCYLRVCPFTKPIGQDCTIEKRADQCCPIVTCPDVPVDLLTSTTTSPAEYGSTGIGKLDKFGCSINGKYFPEGAKVPPSPNKPCEHCYCIRNMTTCVMQECTLHVDGCTPIYHKDVCCPVRYSCDHPEDDTLLLDDLSTTVRPTPGFLLTTTTVSPVTQMSQDCVYDNRVFPDGALIKTEKACDHCYCMKGDIVCVVQECGTPMENEGKNCTALLPREGVCCPDTYICEGDEPTTGTYDALDFTTQIAIEKLTTLSPPRRTSSEGSGYRNEPDEIPYTEPEVEGSGEEEVPKQPFEPITDPTPGITDEMLASTEEVHEFIPLTTNQPLQPEEIPEISTARVNTDGENVVSSDDVNLNPEYQESLSDTTVTYTKMEDKESVTDKTYTQDTGSGEKPEDDSLGPDEEIFETSKLPITEENEVTTDINEVNMVTSGQIDQELYESEIPVTNAPVDDQKNTNEPIKDDTLTGDTEDKTTSQLPIEDDKVTGSPEIEKSTAITELTKQTPLEENSSKSSESFESATTTNIPVTENDIKQIEGVKKEENLEPQHYSSSTTFSSIDDEFVTTETQENELPTETEKEMEKIKPQLHITTSTPMLEEIEKDTTEYKEPDDVVSSDVTKNSAFDMLSTTISNIASMADDEEDITEPTSLQEHMTVETVSITTEAPAYDHQSVSSIEPQLTPQISVEANVEDNSESEQLPLSTSNPEIDESGRRTVQPDLAIKTTAEDDNKLEIISSSTPFPLESEETTTEPDKGLNTIPSDLTNEEAPVSPEIPKSTIKSEESITTESDVATMFSSDSDIITTPSILTTIPSDTSVSREETAALTTESAFREEDYTTTENEIRPELTTATADIKEVMSTVSSDDSTRKTDSALDTQITTTSKPNYSDILRETILPEEVTDGLLHESSTPKEQYQPVTEKDYSNEEKITTTASLYEKTPETTTENQNDNEIFSEPRIPGEGDCLINGVRYINESTVPSSNKCQSGCRCISSIVKCDPIICSPPPEYMNNCETTYDSPDSCCPTYICDHKTETIPPQSHSQMSGTEPSIISPVPCQGNDCGINGDEKNQLPSVACKSESCEGQTDTSQETSSHDPSKVSDLLITNQNEGCSGTNCRPTSCTEENGCQAIPVKPCEGEKCEGSNIPQPCVNGKDCDTPTKECSSNDCISTNVSFEGTYPKDVPNISDEECKEVGCKKIDKSPLEQSISDHCTGIECKKAQESIELTTTSILEQASEVNLEKDTTEIMKESDTTEKIDKFTEQISHSHTTTAATDINETATKQIEITSLSPFTTVTDNNKLVTELEPELVPTSDSIESHTMGEITSLEHEPNKNKTGLTESIETPSLTTEPATKDYETKTQSSDEIATEISNLYITPKDINSIDEHVTKTESPQQIETSESDQTLSDVTATKVTEYNTDIPIVDATVTAKTSEVDKKLDSEEDTEITITTQPPKAQYTEHLETTKSPSILEQEETSATYIQDSSTQSSQATESQEVTASSDLINRDVITQKAMDETVTEITKLSDDSTREIPEKSGTTPSTLFNEKQSPNTEHTSTALDVGTETPVTFTNIELEGVTEMPKEKDSSVVTEESLNDISYTPATQPEITVNYSEHHNDVTTAEIIDKPGEEPINYTDKPITQEDSTNSISNEIGITSSHIYHTEPQIVTKSPIEIEENGTTLSSSDATSSDYSQVSVLVPNKSTSEISEITTKPSEEQEITKYAETTEYFTETLSTKLDEIFETPEKADSKPAEDTDYERTTTSIANESSTNTSEQPQSIVGEIDTKPVPTLEFSTESSVLDDTDEHKVSVEKEYISTTIKTELESESDSPKQQTSESDYATITAETATENSKIEETPNVAITEVTTPVQEPFTSGSFELTTPPSILHSKVTAFETTQTDATENGSVNDSEIQTQTDSNSIATESSMKDQTTSISIPSKHDITTDSPLTSNSDHEYEENMPTQQATQISDLETQTVSPSTADQKGDAQIDSQDNVTTQQPDKLFVLDKEPMNTEISVPAIETMEVHETTPTEIQDSTTLKPSDLEKITEYPELDITLQTEQTSEKIPVITQEVSTEEIEQENKKPAVLEEAINTGRPPTVINIGFTTQRSELSTLEENLTEEHVTMHTSPKPVTEYDATKLYPSEEFFTIEPTYHEAKEPENPVVQSLVTEEHETSTKPSSLEKVTQVVSESDRTQSTEQDKLPTSSSKLPDNLIDIDQKLESVTSTDNIIPFDKEIRTDSPTFVATEQILTTEHITSSPPVDTETIEPNKLLTEKQEPDTTDKFLVDEQTLPTESQYTTNTMVTYVEDKQTTVPDKSFTGSEQDLTKTPGFESQETNLPAISSTSTGKPMFRPGSEDNISTTDSSDNYNKQPEITSESNVPTELSSVHEPTTAPKHEYLDVTTGPSENVDLNESTTLDKDITTENTKVTEGITTAQTSEIHSEQQPDTIETLSPQYETPVEEHLTTELPKIHLSMASTVENIPEKATDYPISSEEVSTALDQDNKIPATHEYEQTTPEIEHLSTSGESFTVQTERVPVGPAKPAQETTAPEEELLLATSKPTSIKSDEEMQTIVDSTSRATDRPEHVTTTFTESITIASEQPVETTPEPFITNATAQQVTVVPESLTTIVTESSTTNIPEIFNSNAPEATITNVPEAPFTNAPKETITLKPEGPIAFMPNAPITKAPDELLTTGLVASIVTVSDMSTTNTPQEEITTTSESLHVSELNEPMLNPSEKPISVSLEKEVMTDFDVSMTNVPEELSTIAPETLVTTAPEKLGTLIPEESVPVASEASITTISDIPVSTMPQAAVTTTSELLITTTAAIPVTSLSEEPAKTPYKPVPVPSTVTPDEMETKVTEATATKSTEKPITKAPEATITKKPEPTITKTTTAPVTLAPETPKPVSTESHPTDDLPATDEEVPFPPSGGTSGYGQEPDYVEEDQTFGPGTCRYGGKVYVSAQQIPRDDPCDFCFCFRSDIICLQQSCPPPIHGCHEEPIQGFCCPRYECPVSMATTVNVTTTTTTTTTTLPPHFPTHSYKGSVLKQGCQIKGQTYKVGEVVRVSSGPCLHCTCGGDGQMKCDPKVCTPEPMLRQMIAAAVSAKRRR